MYKIVLAGLTAAFAVLAQNPIAVSGTVQDSKTKALLSGAVVKLQKLGLTTTSDADGKFMFTGTALLPQGDYRNGKIPVVTMKSLFYNLDVAGEVRVRIFDCSGKSHAELFSERLESGLWQVAPPALIPGMYLCTFETRNSYHAVKFLAGTGDGSMHNKSLQMHPVKSDEASSTLAKQRAAQVAVDTLVVTKNGYREARSPLSSLQKSGIAILLEDTAATVATDDATIVPDPSWTCYMPDGIPPPKSGTAAFTITMELRAIHKVGLTKFGERFQYDVKGGTIAGSKLNGTLLDGGLDYELTLSNGSMEIEQIVILKTSDNKNILMRNAGVAAAGDKAARVVLDFEAPNSSSYTWLHTGKFVANRIVDTVAKTIKLDVYDVSSATLPSQRVQIKDPAGVDNQTWECLKWSGTEGTEVFTENCLLGATINLGASKRGSRNIMLITGGTTTGRVKGKILSGGADFQLSGGIDARYTLAPDDGEFIIIRNCGSGQLIPVFEARVAGPYNFLNENKYLSSPPGAGSGGVSIKFSEKK